MQKIKLSMIAVAVLFTMLLSACSVPTSNGTPQKAEVLCDVEKFANISSAELVGMLGKPDNIEKTTTNGFAKFPCVYYEYSNASELGEVNFILINDSVVKLVSYNTYPYNDGKNLLESFNLSLGEKGAQNRTDTYARFRCPTDKVDDLWITNIDTSANTFATLQVAYDMFYFEEWYIPLTDITEETNYQVQTQNTVKALLKAPKTAKFPSILDWTILKNKFYVIAQAYVDAQNSFGAEIRSEFTFVYKVDTNIVIYAVFDGEVIADNGYVKTETLVRQLIDESKTNNATKTDTTPNTTTKPSQSNDKANSNDTQQKENNNDPKPSNNSTSNNTTSNSQNSNTQQNTEHTHKWDNGTVTKEASCSQEGVKQFVCTTCGDKKEESISKLAHTFSQKVESQKYLKERASWTSGAVYYYSCSCGEKGTQTFSLNDRKEWISAEQLESKFGYSATWMGDYIQIQKHNWDTGTTDKYIINGSPSSKMDPDVVYSGTCNGKTVKFKYSPVTSYNSGNLFFDYNDLVSAGIL